MKKANQRGYPLTRMGRTILLEAIDARIRAYTSLLSTLNANVKGFRPDEAELFQMHTVAAARAQACAHYAQVQNSTVMPTFDVSNYL